MSIHDGLVLLAIYVGVIGAGALIEYVEHRVKRAVHRKKRSWKTSLFFIKTLDKSRSKCYTISTVKKGENKRWNTEFIPKTITALALATTCRPTSRRRKKHRRMQRLWRSLRPLSGSWSTVGSSAKNKGWKSPYFFIKNSWQIQK